MLARCDGSPGILTPPGRGIWCVLIQNLNGCVCGDNVTRLTLNLSTEPRENSPKKSLWAGQNAGHRSYIHIGILVGNRQHEANPCLANFFGRFSRWDADNSDLHKRFRRLVVSKG